MSTTLIVLLNQRRTYERTDRHTQITNHLVPQRAHVCYFEEEKYLQYAEAFKYI
jgi:hypothetical protein